MTSVVLTNPVWWGDLENAKSVFDEYVIDINNKAQSALKRENDLRIIRYSGISE